MLPRSLARVACLVFLSGCSLDLDGLGDASVGDGAVVGDVGRVDGGGTDIARVDATPGLDAAIDGDAGLDMREGSDPACPDFNELNCVSVGNRSAEMCGCGEVGHRCIYIDLELTCACDHLYHCSKDFFGGCPEGDSAGEVVCDGG